MEKSISVSAPGKLMLLGEHAVIYNRPCIVTAVDQRLTTKITLNGQNFIEIDSPDVGVVAKKINLRKRFNLRGCERNVRFILSALNNFQKESGFIPGLRIETKSDFPYQFGFGSSSAVTVGVVFALSKLFGKNYPKTKLFKIGYQAVLDVQGVGSGFDIAAAIWGGTIYFVTGGRKIQPLSNRKLPLVVGYTGIKADTSKLVKKVASLRQRNRKEIEEIFNLITYLVNQAGVNIRNQNFQKLGELMNINQGLLESLGVNTIELSSLIYAARNSGAYGAKLSGAGGGDCMIAFASKVLLDKVGRAINQAGGKNISIVSGAEGVRLEK